DRAARDDVAHSEGTDALQRKATAWLERHGLAVTDLLHRDQRHLREDLRVLGFSAEFLVSAHHGHHQSCLRSRLLQLNRIPLADGVVDGLAALAATQKVECSLAELGVKVERDHMAAVAGFTEERNFEKRAGAETAATGRPAVDGFPLPFEEAAETAQRLPYIKRDV